MMIVGIDPSITRTGLAWSEGNGQIQTQAFQAANDTNPNVTRRIRRYEELIYRLNLKLQELAPDAIFIESYAHGKNPGTTVKLAELGGILRWHLLDHTEWVFEVQPTRLKKFVTGKGSGDKAVIMAHIVNRWGAMFENSDEADAYALLRLGRSAAGLEKDTTKTQAEICEEVVGDLSEPLRNMAAGIIPGF